MNRASNFPVATPLEYRTQLAPYEDASWDLYRNISYGQTAKALVSHLVRFGMADNTPIIPEDLSPSECIAEVVGSRYENHSLSDGAGNALDIINMLTGTANARIYDRHDPADFVGVDKLWQRAWKLGAIPDNVTDLFNRFTRPISQQLLTGQPAAGHASELVFDGAFTIICDDQTSTTRGNYGLHRGTLAMLARRANDRRQGISSLLGALTSEFAPQTD